MRNPFLSPIVCLVVSLFALVNRSPSQKSTPQTYCNRIYHSISILAHTLYVDGGEFPATSALNASNITTYVPSTTSTVNLYILHVYPSQLMAATQPRSSLIPPARRRQPSQAARSSQTHKLSTSSAAPSLSPASPAMLPSTPTITLDNNSVWQYAPCTKQWSVVSAGGDAIQNLILETSVQSQTAPYEDYYLGGVK